MDTKAAFEKFVIDHDPRGHCTNLLAMNEDSTKYLHPHVDIAWKAWTASRAAIEIDIKNLENHPDDYFMDGYNDAISDVTDELTSHGIRIKGKTE